MSGRPKKSKDEKRSNVLRILLKEEERAALDKEAQSKTLDTSSWARMVLLEIIKKSLENS